MLTIATITDKARKTLQDTPNIFQIALIPVLISVKCPNFSHPLVNLFLRYTCHKTDPIYISVTYCLAYYFLSFMDS